ncbi:MAG: SDR family NAD(P)-dependent oxidoreductase [Alphaproteobacteria bacterium]|nr:SDR family NAD(P)-dependent oxidoreductase [Alphaproteobacteria bacterium]
MPGRLAGRIALITGASRGIGAAVALRYAQEGAHLVLIARTQGGLEEVDDRVRAIGGQATLLPLDLGEVERIDQMAAAVHARFGRLDILVANAASLGVLTPLAHLAPDVWNATLNLNLTANWRLIRALDPLLRVSEAGRAIFVTSGVARGAVAYWGAYAVAKAGLEMLAKVYAAETAKTAIRVNILDPGVVATRMRAQAFPGEDPASLPSPESLGDIFVELGEAGCHRHGEVVGAGR